jgi:hypothetical protein
VPDGLTDEQVLMCPDILVGAWRAFVALGRAPILLRAPSETQTPTGLQRTSLEWKRRVVRHEGWRFAKRTTLISARFSLAKRKGRPEPPLKFSITLAGRTAK